jgi:hypothetical protein
MSADKGARIRALNDQLRRYLIGGHVYLSHGVKALGQTEIETLMRAIAEFDDFDDGNDPFGEHDFGAVEVEGQRYFFKIDYYADADFSAGTEDASDPDRCTRVLTVMHPAEY